MSAAWNSREKGGFVSQYLAVDFVAGNCQRMWAEEVGRSPDGERKKFRRVEGVGEAR
jgi:hypothetical protein